MLLWGSFPYDIKFHPCVQQNRKEVVVCHLWGFVTKDSVASILVFSFQITYSRESQLPCCKQPSWWKTEASRPQHDPELRSWSSSSNRTFRWLWPQRHCLQLGREKLWARTTHINYFLISDPQRWWHNKCLRYGVTRSGNNLLCSNRQLAYLSKSSEGSNPRKFRGLLQKEKLALYAIIRPLLR
jgi:hypothetical protein